ncbi:MAG: NADH-quinone oxidoreductase subunit C [Xanthomonadaceae bacterium]|nr:NADH-quinone oxidoreductase subunit C [Xanthomonadaceae bacterium]MDE1960892.1 NADH-quinone oxidoreductase subunit C [Xanthomonadaceae bacterium]
MRERFPDLVFHPLPGALPATRVETTPTQLVTLCRSVREAGGRLVTLWGEDLRDEGLGFRLCVALDANDALILAELRLSADNPVFPDLSGTFPSADRLQRAVRDLVGLRAIGGDARPWLRHGAWPTDVFPLRRDAPASSPAAPAEYAFVRVEGDGVHEIPVGPVHAGIIEPGHFRFSVVGEKVLRLEERLGYTHKGIEKRSEGLTATDGARLVARVCGDSTAAYAWAYAMAVESATGTTPSPRALQLRAVLLERERLANHLGDLGALGNDAGFAFGLAQFSRLKEDLLRANAAVWGQRYPMDAIVPGGVRGDVDADAARMLTANLDAIALELARLREIYDNHAGLQDRFLDAGRVSPELASQLGMVGLCARASGSTRDWRNARPVFPYTHDACATVTRSQGDVAARVAVRFDEAVASIALCRGWLAALPAGDLRVPLRTLGADALGVGGVEGWRGPVFVAVRLDAAGRIRRCHPHDPSWHNWPALEHAIIDNIVPDFPLINKSFNLSYSGHDL